MRLGLMLGYTGAKFELDMERVLLAEQLGYDSVWTAEAWGSDAISPLAWIGALTTKIRLGTAIMQCPGRSPANAAMTAMTMDAMSGGRFIMGLGTSGPQVVEGWHGVPFNKPLTWLKEYIHIVRTILERKEPLAFDGVRYQLPYMGPGSSGQGKSLKSILHGNPKLPIYTGSMAPKSQQVCAEIADGCLVTCYDPTHPEIIEDNFAIGLAKAGKSRADFDLAPAVAVVVGDDLDVCRMPLKHSLALYVGGMGSKKKNFYKDYVCKVGFEEAAEKIQDLYLAGRKVDAINAVPDEMVDRFNLVGPPERIRDHFARWQESPVDSMLIGCQQQEAIELMAELNS
jgi:F420-dependent oxidoreductase-like protein